MGFNFQSAEVAGITKALVWWYRKALELRSALKQAYLDGGCQEDEAEEMTNAVLQRREH